MSLTRLLCLAICLFVCVTVRTPNAEAGSNVDSKTWSKFFHHSMARSLGYDSRRIDRFFLFAEDEFLARSTIPLSLGSVVNLADTPFQRVRQNLGNPQILKQFAQPLKGQPAPFLKSLQSLDSILVMVPGLGSEFLPLYPFGREVLKFRANEANDPYSMIIATIAHPTGSAVTGARELAAFLRNETPLFDYDEYKNKKLVFVAYDQGVNQVLEMLANPANKSILSRTRTVVSVGGLLGGIPWGANSSNAKTAHYLAHVIAVAGEFMAQAVLPPDPKKKATFQSSLASSINAVGGGPNSATLKIAAPALDQLQDPAVVAELKKQAAAQVTELVKGAVLSPKVGGPVPDALKRYRTTLKEYTRDYSELVARIGKALEDLNPAVKRPRTNSLLSQIRREDGKPVTLFTIGSIADLAEFRLTPNVRTSAAQGMKLLPLGGARGGSYGFSWDDMLWYLLSQPGFFKDARFNGFATYPAQLVLDESGRDAAPGTFPGVTTVNLGAFHTDHWGLAVGGVLSPIHPFPRGEMFEALIETLSQYQDSNP